MASFFDGIRSLVSGSMRDVIGSARRGSLSQLSGYVPRLGRNVAIGAGIGATYGAMSDNTSVLGGAFMGALGGGMYTGGRLATSMGVSAAAMSSRARGHLTGMGMAQSWARQMYASGAASVGHIGSYLRSGEPVQKIKGLWGGASRYMDRAVGAFNYGYYGTRMTR